ncbi:hypothetical protein EXIGLDRAFT_831768 [Exidia glandulosa HHB12029]|uniref:Uncharacterized protein n=1 Tax=Exidia glandulosa HHB12029 TaxID=1314781 RepID=A0A165MAB8_EXIGL|nr:hypothetical protein EXIGLDRAFT_831768 [Exidia glandulosa HHB12029]
MRELAPTTTTNANPSPSSSSFRHWFTGHGGRPSSFSSSSRQSTAQSTMAAPATAVQPQARPFRSTTSSKLSAFASAFGFGSRSSSKGHRGDRAQYDPQRDIQSDPAPHYQLDHDPFGPARLRTTLSPSPAQPLPLPSLQLPQAASSSSSRPEFPRSKSDVGSPRQYELPSLPLPSPPASDVGGASSSHGLFYRKRNDSATNRGKSAALLPVGNGNSAAESSKRGSWHKRQRSSIDMQLPQLARSPRTSDDFSSILDAVANAGLKPLPSTPPLLPTSPDAAMAPGQASASRSTAHHRQRTTSARAPPAAPLPSPPVVQRTRSHTTSEGSKKRAGAPITTSPNTLRKLLPTLPPTSSLPPTPPQLQQDHNYRRNDDRPSSSPTAASPNGQGLLGQPRTGAMRPSTSQGTGLSVQTMQPRLERALSPITPSPTSAMASATHGLSPRVSSSESSSLLFAAVPDSDRSEASSVVSSGAERRRKQMERPSTSTGIGSPTSKESALARALFSDDTATPRGSISMSIASSDLPPFSAYSVQSRRTSNASTVHAHVLRKSTSQTFDGRQRVDSNATTVTVRSTVWVGGANANRSDLSPPSKLVRKQRSLHSVAIPPVPRQAVPQPPTPEPSADFPAQRIGTSPPGPSLLSSWSLKRRSSSRAGDPPESAFLSLTSPVTSPKDEAVPGLQHVGSLKSLRDMPRRPSVTSPIRPSTPQSTFFDDTDSTHRASISLTNEVASPKSRRGSVNARRASDIAQYIIPPEELASSWGSTVASTSTLNNDAAAKAGDSSLAPSDSSTRVPASSSKSMPSSPTRRTINHGSSSTPPSRAVSFVGSKRPDELLVLSSPVGFGGGLALAPMPPRKPQSHSAGRARGGSLLGEASRSAGLQAPPRGSRRPSLIASSIRSDSALRSITSSSTLRGTSAAALDLMTTRARPISKASSGSGASSSDAFMSPTSASSSGPPPVGRKRSILKKPSFLDFENDDADDATSSRRVAAQRKRAKPIQVQLTPPPQTPPPAPPAKQKTASTNPADLEDMTDSFLDLGRMSFETSHTSSSTEDPAADGISFDQETTAEFLKWGR